MSTAMTMSGEFSIGMLNTSLISTVELKRQSMPLLLLLLDTKEKKKNMLPVR
jgi:hypothetical protein